MEIVDRRAEKRAAEAAAPKEPTALEIAEDHERRYSEALANGDMNGSNAVAAECSYPPPTDGRVVPFKKQSKGEVLGWKSVGYVVAMLPVGQATVMMLRAVGLRTDERLFTADYAIPGMIDEGEDFVVEARRRLDTFKACSCDQRGHCGFHAVKVPGQTGPGEWLKSDIERLQKQGARPMPEAVEVLMRAEAARAQQRIVVPGAR